MGVMPGYKQTELGVIPMEWDVKTLFDLADRRKELFDDGDWIESEHITSTGVRLIQTGNIGVGSFIEKDIKKYIYEESFTSLQCKQLQEGDLLVCRLADPAGRACVLPDIGEGRVVTSVDVTIFRPPPHVADRRFLSNLFSTPEWFRAVGDRSGGTTHKRIARGALGRIAIQLPPLPEQQAIAEALSDADALIESLEQLLAKKRQIKRGAMQELLTGKQRLPGFSGEWGTVPAGAIGQFRGGNGFPLQFQGSTAGDYPFFKVSDMNIAGNETEMIVANNYISESVRKQVGATVFPENTIVFAKVGAAVHLERKKRLLAPSCIDNNMAGLVIDDVEIDYHFIHHFLLSFKLGSLVATTALPSLNSSVLREIPVPRPPTKAEQTAIAEVLSDMGAELASLDTKLTKARQLKQGMMQALLTGRIRLV